MKLSRIYTILFIYYLFITFILSLNTGYFLSESKISQLNDKYKYLIVKFINIIFIKLYWDFKKIISFRITHIMELFTNFYIIMIIPIIVHLLYNLVNKKIMKKNK